MYRGRVCPAPWISNPCLNLVAPAALLPALSQAPPGALENSPGRKPSGIGPENMPARHGRKKALHAPQLASWTKNYTGQAADGTEMFSVSRAKGKTRLHSCGCDQSIG